MTHSNSQNIQNAPAWGRNALLYNHIESRVNDGNPLSLEAPLSRDQALERLKSILNSGKEERSLISLFRDFPQVLTRSGSELQEAQLLLQRLEGQGVNSTLFQSLKSELERQQGFEEFTANLRQGLPFLGQNLWERCFPLMNMGASLAGNLAGLGLSYYSRGNVWVSIAAGVGNSLFQTVAQVAHQRYLGHEYNTRELAGEIGDAVLSGAACSALGYALNQVGGNEIHWRLLRFASDVGLDYGLSGLSPVHYCLGLGSQGFGHLGYGLAANIAGELFADLHAHPLHRVNHQISERSQQNVMINQERALARSSKNNLSVIAATSPEEFASYLAQVQTAPGSSEFEKLSRRDAENSLPLIVVRKSAAPQSPSSPGLAVVENEGDLIISSEGGDFSLPPLRLAASNRSINSGNSLNDFVAILSATLKEMMRNAKGPAAVLSEVSPAKFSTSQAFQEPISWRDLLPGIEKLMSERGNFEAFALFMDMLPRNNLYAKLLTEKLWQDLFQFRADEFRHLIRKRAKLDPELAEKMLLRTDDSSREEQLALLAIEADQGNPLSLLSRVLNSTNLEGAELVEPVHLMNDGLNIQTALTRFAAHSNIQHRSTACFAFILRGEFEKAFPLFQSLKQVAQGADAAQLLINAYAYLQRYYACHFVEHPDLFEAAEILGEEKGPVLGEALLWVAENRSFSAAQRNTALLLWQQLMTQFISEENEQRAAQIDQLRKLNDRLHAADEKDLKQISEKILNDLGETRRFNLEAKPNPGFASLMEDLLQPKTFQERDLLNYCKLLLPQGNPQILAALEHLACHAKSRQNMGEKSFPDLIWGGQSGFRSEAVFALDSYPATPAEVFLRIFETSDKKDVICYAALALYKRNRAAGTEALKKLTQRPLYRFPQAIAALLNQEQIENVLQILEEEGFHFGLLDQVRAFAKLGVLPSDLNEADYLNALKNGLFVGPEELESFHDEKSARMLQAIFEGEHWSDHRRLDALKILLRRKIFLNSTVVDAFLQKYLDKKNGTPDRNTNLWAIADALAEAQNSFYDEKMRQLCLQVYSQTKTLSEHYETALILARRGIQEGFDALGHYLQPSKHRKDSEGLEKIFKEIADIQDERAVDLLRAVYSNIKFKPYVRAIALCELARLKAVPDAWIPAIIKFKEEHKYEFGSYASLKCIEALALLGVPYDQMGDLHIGYQHLSEFGYNSFSRPNAIAILRGMLLSGNIEGAVRELSFFVHAPQMQVPILNLLQETWDLPEVRAYRMMEQFEKISEQACAAFSLEESIALANTLADLFQRASLPPQRRLSAALSFAALLKQNIPPQNWAPLLTPVLNLEMDEELKDLRKHLAHQILVDLGLVELDADLEEKTGAPPATSTPEIPSAWQSFLSSMTTVGSIAVASLVQQIWRKLSQKMVIPESTSAPVPTPAQLGEANPLESLSIVGLGEKVKIEKE